VTKSPRLYILFRTAVTGILPVTRLPLGFMPWLGGIEPVTYSNVIRILYIKGFFKSAVIYLKDYSLYLDNFLFIVNLRIN